MDAGTFNRTERSEVKKCSTGEETLLDLESVISSLLAAVEELKHKLDPILESERAQTEGKSLREPHATIPPYFSGIRECTYQARAARDKLQDIIDRIGL